MYKEENDKFDKFCENVRVIGLMHRCADLMVDLNKSVQCCGNSDLTRTANQLAGQLDRHLMVSDVEGVDKTGNFEMQSGVENVDMELDLIKDINDLWARVRELRPPMKHYHEIRVLMLQIRMKNNELQDLRDAKIFEPQSGVVNDQTIMQVGSDSKQQNIAFADQVDPYMTSLDGEVDSTRRLQDSDDAMLENFFSRPIKIHEEEWSTSTTLGFDIDPWELYFENARVSNRLANFNLLRAKLHVKVLVNGNGFQYGRALCYYQPFEYWDSLTTNAALVTQDLVQGSQMPHIFLDPTTSQGGEMVLPFFWYKNYLNVTESDWEEMGQLFFRSLNDLKHANGATDVVTISVFAWAEDVSMSVLTSVESSTLSPQSGTEADEVNEKGIISGPATAIAKGAGWFRDIPYIGPFATATEMAASTTASIAKMFGYCRPAVTKAPEPYRPMAVSNLALTNTGDTALKLSVDAKQELSIDPRIAGLGGADPLDIKEIAKRESYLTTFSWNIGTAPETLLFNSRVSPVLWNESGATAYHFPACCMAALPFRYWTGSMKFRFQIVCSAFHKGRLKIVYDPNFIDGTEYNVNYMQIVDIADKTDFTIEINNGQEFTTLDHSYPGVDALTQIWSPGGIPYSSKEPGNGVIGVYVVNELTTPNSTVNNDIEVNVFISMGDDFEVFVPEEHFQNFVFATQSGTELVSEAQNTQEPSAPQQTNTLKVGPTMCDLSDVNKVFTGEAIKSFRTMLKRYNLWSIMPLTTAGGSVYSGQRCLMPYLRGYLTGGVDLTSTLDEYNYCNTILLHWVTLAFQGWRGSIRYKFVPHGLVGETQSTTTYVSRNPENPASYIDARVAVDTNVTQSAGRAFAVKNNGLAGAPTLASRAPTGPSGVAVQQADVNSCIEFEVPYYSASRFSPGKVSDYHILDLVSDGWLYRTYTNGSTYGNYAWHVATGEDFQVYCFTGLPRMYYEPAAPAPTAI